ncbi:MAG: sodium-dependent transporter [Firmicutes bacterium]|nr:sodium-dependent transporter [Bacillota bacterium]MDD7601538.1 sodium-dependent transporter [Bacillota bacterium]MDY3239370.1 sodium-dependent transporter [Anaerovoracaceae bacterium]MDY5855584.1 sodium-dependent transporter [Anaerovoracaceae bacterium]
MEHHHKKGEWNSSFGFLMAAVGSAVGLGNLWAFPYKMGKNGGFAFLLIYLILVATVGIVICLTELSLGRKTGKGVVAAYESISKKYSFVGWFAWISPMLIMGFYCMLGGYCLKYAVANLGDLFGASWGVNGADSSEYFSSFFTDQVQTSIFTLIIVALTVVIVMGGVAKGIERFSTIAMPALFVMMVIIIIRSVTMDGASEGLSFVFKPNFEVFRGTGWISVLASAGGQMFFSLSLGMGITVTYGSYMKKTESLQRNAFLIPIADTIVAVMAACAIMPAVFASGLNPGQGPSLLFVTLQTVFQAMGSIGPFFGFLLYFLVFIAAITSSIALLEAASAVIMDKQIEKGKQHNRKMVCLLIGLFVAAEGVFVSLDGLGANGFPQILGQGCWLDTFDLISEGVLMPLGALITALIFGWFKTGKEFTDDEIALDQGGFRIRRYYHFCLRWIVPVILLLVLLGQISTFFGLDWF